MNELEKYQFEILKRYVLNPNEFDRLILEYNWSRNQFEIFMNILNNFDEKETFTYQDFETTLNKTLGINYQGTKVIITYLYKANQSDKLVYKFIESMRKEGRPLSSEYLSIEKELFGKNIGK
ncbi:hypothetical protein [Commensalibacter oyaizuii]|uniref:Uncharacterized protein n=1 Tax=Commensalibacter oyaizuii TaxID=3043873 RepID=A0ABT6Q5I1_9PROT|nr:hypothetical protein [Commensalibacter sp. TBRC 16381]MDI2091811.1 hypothetical protein [Commensalibacter sp. TBRC 16381]